MANLSDKIGPSGVATGDQGVATTDSPAFAGLTVNGQLGIGGANYGTSGQVLTSNGSGSAPSWQDAASGGWEYVSSATASNTASITFSSLDFDTYEYTVQGYNIKPAVDSDYLFMKLSNGGSYENTRNTLIYASSPTNTAGPISWIQGSDAVDPAFRFSLLMEEVGSDFIGRMFGMYGSISAGIYPAIANIHSGTGQTNITGVQFSYQNGNIATGTFILNRQPRKPNS